MAHANKKFRYRKSTRLVFHVAVISVAFLLPIFASNAQIGVFEPIYAEPAPILAAQYGIDTTNIGAVHAAFDTTSDSNVRELAAVFLAERGVSDIVGRVKQFFHAEWQRQFGSPPYNYALTLYLLRDSEAKVYLHSFIDSVLASKERGRNRFVFSDLELATRLLFNLGDYSRYFLLSSLFDDPANADEGASLNTLAAFADIPEYRDSVYLRLQDFLTHPERRYRWHAVFNLQKFPEKPDLQLILRNVAENDTTVRVQREAIDALKKIYRDPFVFDILERICLTTNDTSDFELSVIDIEYFNHFLAYPTLVRIMNALPSGEFKDYATHSVNFYRPPEPRNNVSLFTLLDSLISTKHQVAAYNWLGDRHFVNELDNHLENARKHFVRGDSSNAYKQVEKFQEKVNKEYEKTIDDGRKNKPRDKRFVTVEGWKFLYYNAQYILDRLPEREKRKDRDDKDDEEDEEREKDEKRDKRNDR